MQINPLNISFKGIKNIGYTKNDTKYNLNSPNFFDDYEEDEYGQYSQNNKVIHHTARLINMQFTDDFNGKHLSEYKKIMDKYPNYKNNFNKNFLNFMHVTLNNDDIFLVNSKQLLLKDKNLPLLSFIAKTINEVAHKDTRDFVVNKDYLLSEDFYKGFMPNVDLSQMVPEPYIMELSRDYHKVSDVKEGAKNLLDSVTDVMMKYFDV